MIKAAQDLKSRQQHDSVLRVVLFYAVFAALWILLSDKAVEAMLGDPEQIILASMIKGWLFVAVTTLLLYGLVKGQVAQLQAAHHREIENYREKQCSLDLLSAIADNSEDAIFAMDRESRFTLFNHACERITGKVSAAVLGHDESILFPGDLAKKQIADNCRVIETGTSQTFEEVIQTANGERVFLTIKGPLRDTSGLVIGMFGIARDITERKHAEQSLMVSEHRFHDIAEVSADWIWEVDAEGRYTFVSESVRNLLGYTPAEIIGKTPFDFMPPDEAARVGAEFASAVAAHKPFRDLDNINLNKDGSIRHVQTTGMPILNAAGELLGYRGLDRDITERMLVERELRESEERYRSVVNNVKEIIFQTDAAGLWTFLNPAWTEVTGFPLETSLGTLFLDYVHPDDRQRNLELFEPLIQRKKDYCRHVIRYLHKDDGFRWIEVYARLTLDESNNIVGTSGTLSDITERKDAEVELQRRNEELERFNRVTIGRELDMIELKKQLNAMSLELGRKPPFPLAFLNEGGDRGP